MTLEALLAALVIVLGASGTYLLLPQRRGTARPHNAYIAGLTLVVIAVLLLATFWTPPGPFLTSLFFYAFAIAAVLGGVLMITSRDPVYSALWFASVVLATSGLFLLAGAQFLAAGTVIVYAGAIIVTFLFVIMLAQSAGRAAYDRAARAPARATLCCFVLLWGLLYAILMVQNPLDRRLSVEEQRYRLTRVADLPDHPGIPARDGEGIAAVAARAVPEATARLKRPDDPDTPDSRHVAGLGGTLFTDHLITIEVAGTLLFVALVGAAAIALPAPKARPERRA